MIKWIILLFLLISLPISGYVQNQGHDHVQKVLAELANKHPNKVQYLFDTRRWYLIRANAQFVTPEIEYRLQDAFLKDVKPLCKGYGKRYLIPWQVLAAKAGRETFWGTSYLCNRGNNFFGIRAQGKPWLCNQFNFCDNLMKNDPEPAAFAVFTNFEASLWMFIHTIYSPHFLDRLPDKGNRVKEAIHYERAFKTHYWLAKLSFRPYSRQLQGKAYSASDIIRTWSGYIKNNLCIACDIPSDLNWVQKIHAIEQRTKPTRH